LNLGGCGRRWALIRLSGGLILCAVADTPDAGELPSNARMAKSDWDADVRAAHVGVRFRALVSRLFLQRNLVSLDLLRCLPLYPPQTR